MAWTNQPSRFPSAIHFVATGGREEKHTQKSTSSFAAAHPVNQPLSFPVLVPVLGFVNLATLDIIIGGIHGRRHRRFVHTRREWLFSVSYFAASPLFAQAEPKCRIEWSRETLAPKAMAVCLSFFLRCEQPMGAETSDIQGNGCMSCSSVKAHLDSFNLWNTP